MVRQSLGRKRSTTCLYSVLLQKASSDDQALNFVRAFADRQQLRFPKVLFDGEIFR
jgi:hypothetical protein